jgi:hypothetical protein
MSLAYLVKEQMTWIEVQWYLTTQHSNHQVKVTDKDKSQVQDWGVVKQQAMLGLKHN